jgi:osmotically-inducible protein OsmY
MKTICLFALTISAGILITAPPLRGATETDKRINEKIFHLLMNDRSLAHGSEKLTATTQNGVVTLVGDVRSQTDKDQLQKAIAGTRDVQRVNDNQVILKPLPATRSLNDQGPIEPKP